ncbi:dTDP-glucose pyrophosphorylase [Kovacikia minuta CCNUW1]|uniref:sugar phosphate nucleotidyltransferase n=1 Tax=Kovacikia minuta TaxID=2931930 RepID=UPI001CCD481D|nr:dTDP-glucose pyrophosphorylase [Kovacikia minuta CCNUW1]
MVLFHPREIIGLIPAAGQATRISPLPLSKELFPIGFQPSGSNNSLRPKVACQYLLEKMKQAGISKAYLILRSGKWDIPTYFGDGAMLGMNLGYLLMGLPYGVPYTLNQAYPFVKGATIAMGFPDILFQPRDAFVRLLERQVQSGAEVVLGLFPTDQPEKVGVVDFDATGRVHLIAEKSQLTHLRYMWAIAVWTPTFTQFLHEYLLDTEKSNEPTLRPELPIGDVIQAAIDRGFQVEAETFNQGR